MARPAFNCDRAMVWYNTEYVEFFEDRKSRHSTGILVSDEATSFEESDFDCAGPSGNKWHHTPVDERDGGRQQRFCYVTVYYRDGTAFARTDSLHQRDLPARMAICLP